MRRFVTAAVVFMLASGCGHSPALTDAEVVYCRTDPVALNLAAEALGVDLEDTRRTVIRAFEERFLGDNMYSIEELDGMTEAEMWLFNELAAGFEPPDDVYFERMTTNPDFVRACRAAFESRS